MKKSLMILVIFIFLFAFFSFVVSAQPPFQSSTTATKSIIIESPVIEKIEANKNFTFHLHPHNSSDGKILPQAIIDYCVLHIYSPDGGDHIVQTNMTPNGNGIDWEYEVDGNNLTEVNKQYAVYIYCQVSGEDRGGFLEFAFELTNEGKDPNYNYLIATVVLILIFMGFGILIYKDKEKMNDEKYWNLMVSRWKDKNYLRFSAAVLWYNLKKNSYILQYLIGLVIMIMVYDITAVYNLDAISSVFRILLGLYTWGSLIVVIVLFGSVQEWLKEWQEELAKINWGAFEGGKQRIS